jgi:hypothetical protein
LRELFVAIALVGLALAMLLPAIHAAREAARRTTCNSKMTCISMSLQNYHDTFKVFPMGAMHSGPNPGGEPPIHAGLGPAWWFGLLPFTEGRNWHDKLLATQKPGGPVHHELCPNDMSAAGIPLNQVPTEIMFCPSSPLPQMETATGPIPLPTYVGIAGGCDIDPNSHDYLIVAGGGSIGALIPPTTRRVYQNAFKGTGSAAGGVVTSSGMLPPCQHAGIADCTDGTSNTMIVAEQSDWLRDQNPASSKKYHGDPGWTVGGTGPGGGWLSGTRRVDPVPAVETPGGPPAPWGADCWNITTVRYRPNLKRVLGATPAPGCSENHGINNPLQSPHPGLLLVGMTDGSVQSLADTTDLGVLLRLAIRNDGVGHVSQPSPTPGTQPEN